MSQTIEVKVPDIGDFKDISIIEVAVKPGDTVAKEQSLITLETDKAAMEVPSPFDGIIRELRVKVGDKVSEGSVILMLESSATAPAPVASTLAPQSTTDAPTLPLPSPPFPSHKAILRQARDRQYTPKCWFWAQAPAATPLHSAQPIWANR